MTESPEDEKLAQLVQKIDPHSRLLHAWELKGGISARVMALEIEQQDGRRQKLVTRQHSAFARKRNPQITADEFKLLQIMQSTGLPTQRPYYLDQSGEIFPAPTLVLEYIEGQSEHAPADLADCIRQLVGGLIAIHRVTGAQVDLAFLPQVEEIYNRKLGARPAQVDDSLDEGRIRDVLEAAWPWPQHPAPALLHGDYWPGNALWREGQLVGIIDWEEARVGDPLEDLANTRMELWWAFGAEAMQQFTQQYQALTHLDLTTLPYWDLCAALRPAGQLATWAVDAQEEQVMREGHRQFVAQALARL